MTVGELLCKMVDSYVDIAVNEYKGAEYTGRRWIIPRHSVNYRDIPEDVWETEVSMIIPYWSHISIEIEAKDAASRNDARKPGSHVTARGLIQKLQEAVKEAGDLPVLIRDCPNGNDFDGFEVVADPASPEEKEQGVTGTIDIHVW